MVLSICIPTYNQPTKIRRLLESIIDQITPEVEVVVRDDSTNDETKIIIDEFSIKIPIRYIRGKKEGLDVAIIFLTHTAKGRYVWWIGDDVIAPGAIAHICSVIKNNPEISFIWINSGDITNNKMIAVDDRTEHFFKDKNEVIETDIGLLGFITSTLFKKESAISGLSAAENYVGSAFVCMYIILHVLTQPGKFYFLGTPYILSDSKPAGEVRWYDQFQVFCINLFSIVMAFEGKFSRQSIRKTLSRNLHYAIKAVIIERAQGLKTGFASSSPKVVPMMRLYWSYWEAWLALPFLICPQFILKILYRGYKKIKQWSTLVTKNHE